MPRLIGSNDKRETWLDVKGDKTLRYDVYDYRTVKEYVVRNMHGYVHCSDNVWGKVIVYGQITAIKFDKRTGIYSETNTKKSQKNWSSDNKNPAEVQPYIGMLIAYLRGEE